jgi:hypothetical protein
MREGVAQGVAEVVACAHSLLLGREKRVSMYEMHQFAALASRVTSPALQGRTGCTSSTCRPHEQSAIQCIRQGGAEPASTQGAGHFLCVNLCDPTQLVYNMSLFPSARPQSPCIYIFLALNPRRGSSGQAGAVRMRQASACRSALVLLF